MNKKYIKIFFLVTGVVIIIGLAWSLFFSIGKKTDQVETQKLSRGDDFEFISKDNSTKLGQNMYEDQLSDNSSDALASDFISDAEGELNEEDLKMEMQSLKIYTNEVYGFSLMYPESWAVPIERDYRSEDLNYEYEVFFGGHNTNSSYFVFRVIGAGNEKAVEYAGIPSDISECSHVADISLNSNVDGKKVLASESLGCDRNIKIIIVKSGDYFYRIMEGGNVTGTKDVDFFESDFFENIFSTIDF